MPITLEQAKRAGALASEINQRLEKTQQIKNAIDEKWSVNVLRAVGSEGVELPLILDALDTETSEQILAFALKYYEAQTVKLLADLETL